MPMLLLCVVCLGVGRRGVCLLCQACRQRWYCGIECQKADWGVHDCSGADTWRGVQAVSAACLQHTGKALPGPAILCVLAYAGDLYGMFPERKKKRKTAKKKKD